MPEDLKKIKSELEKVSALVVALSLTQKDHNIPTFKKIDKDISTINEGLDGVNKSIEGIKESLITLDTATKKNIEDKLSLFEAKVQSIKDMIPTLKDGETPSDEKLVSLIKPLIPKPEKGDKGDTPVAGVDFPLPEDGITPTNEEIIDLIKPLIPPVKDGSPDTAEDIRNKLELLQGDERLDVDYIRGVEELIDDKISEIPIPKERGGRGGVVQFTALVDTPSSYVGQAGKVATVNATETALEFTTPTGGAGGTPASSVTDETTYGITPAVGTSTNFARQDHTHGTPTTPTKTTVGLANVDNTSDTNKPVSTAQALADAAVQAFSIQRTNHTGTQLAATISDFAAAVAALISGTPTGSKFLRDDFSWQVPPSGGGGSVILTEVEIDLGTDPISSKSFTITDASVDATKKIIVFPSPNPATSRVGNDWEFDAATFSALAGTGTFTLYLNSLYGMVGKRNVYYQIV